MKIKKTFLWCLTAVFVITGPVFTAFSGLKTVQTEAAVSEELKDGTYEINGILKHASSDNQASMGNAAMIKPFRLIKSGKSYTLQIEMQKLKSGVFEGYLGKLWYFPNWTDEIHNPSQTGESQSCFADPAARVEAAVKSYYDVTDSFNHPETGTDAIMKGKMYPHYVTLNIKENQSLVWVQVYVPIMEAISTGGGTQYARLMLDWSSVKLISETAANNSTVTVPEKEKITYAKSVKKKQILIKWKKQNSVSGYQIQVSTKKNFKTGTKTYKVTNYKTTSKTIKNLKSKKTYYVRVRSYSKSGSTCKYGAWSAVKKVKTK